MHNNHIELIQTMVASLFVEYPILTPIIAQLEKVNARVYLVGGAVRDIFLGKQLKDIDLEVHGISLEHLQELLSAFGSVDIVGKSFGILRIMRYPIDWSVPRSDASGRKPSVTLDPFMDVKQAAARRDVTINAMMIDLMSRTLCDPFHGLDDLHNKILRAPDPALFMQDPLRFYRIMQFIARFDMAPDPTLQQICTTMDVCEVSRERIEAELTKLLLQSVAPSRGFRWVAQLGRMSELFPELGAVQGVPQNPNWHPEGDVFEHTMQALDAMARIDYDDASINCIMRYAALCHDLGKAVSTQLHNGTWRSIGHAITGVPIARSFLKRFTQNQHLISTVERLVLHHMAPGEFVKNNAKAGAYKNLAYKLSPYTTLAFLADLSCADKQGRNPHGHVPLDHSIVDVDTFREFAQSYGVLHGPEAPVLLGRDLLEVVPPGPELGQAVQNAYIMQIREGVTDLDTLKKHAIRSILHKSKQKKGRR